MKVMNYQHYSVMLFVDGIKYLFNAGEIKEVSESFRGKHNACLVEVKEPVVKAEPIMPKPIVKDDYAGYDVSILKPTVKEPVDNEKLKTSDYSGIIINNKDNTGLIIDDNNKDVCNEALKFNGGYDGGIVDNKKEKKTKPKKRKTNKKSTKLKLKNKRISDKKRKEHAFRNTNKEK